MKVLAISLLLPSFFACSSSFEKLCFKDRLTFEESKIKGIESLSLENGSVRVHLNGSFHDGYFLFDSMSQTDITFHAVNANPKCPITLATPYGLWIRDPQPRSFRLHYENPDTSRHYLGTIDLNPVLARR